MVQRGQIIPQIVDLRCDNQFDIGPVSLGAGSRLEGMLQPVQLIACQLALQPLEGRHQPVRQAVNKLML